MKGARILIVEDEGIVAISMRFLLEEFGYEVTGIASSGEDALAQAEHDRPDLVLMDIRLKGRVDGIEAAELIRGRFDIPVVFLTGYSNDKTMERAIKTAPVGFIEKPVGADVLRETIGNALKRHDK